MGGVWRVPISPKVWTDFRALGWVAKKDRTMTGQDAMTFGSGLGDPVVDALKETIVSMITDKIEM